METIGLDTEEVKSSVVFALIGFAIVFTVLSPIAGSVVHRVTHRLLPGADKLALMATALLVFVLNFGIIMGVLLRIGPAVEIGLPMTLLISLLSAALVTGVTALLVKRGLQRASRNIQPEDYAFKVWDEDARERRKNLRRR